MGNAMGPYNYFHSIPSTTEMFTYRQQEMMRSMSQNSMQQFNVEAAPSLLSSTSAPSVPSASSSTVGSPYSGHAQLAPNSFLYNNNFITGPAIICDDSFAYGYESANFDHEAIIGQDTKSSSPFVGKCADLSSFAQRSTGVLVQEYLSSVPLVSSPEPTVSITKAASTSLSKRVGSADGSSAQIRSIAFSSKSQSNAVFKSPTTSASAYSKTCSSHARTMTCPPSEPRKDPFWFSYSFPFSTESSLPQHDFKHRCSFLYQPGWDLTSPVGASCPSSQSFCLRLLQCIVQHL